MSRSRASSKTDPSYISPNASPRSTSAEEIKARSRANTMSPFEELKWGGLSPRTRLSKNNALSAQIIIDVMRCLDETKVASIRRYFMKHEDHAVDINQFVRIMLKNLDNFQEKRNAMYDAVDKKDEEDEEISTFDLVSNLRELFDEIDINGDKKVEWDEFTAFIVEKASLTSYIGLNALTRFEEILKDPGAKTIQTQPIENAFFVQPLDVVAFYIEKEVTSESLFSASSSNAGGPCIKLYNVEDLTEVASLRNKDIRGAPTAYAYVGDHLTHHSSSVQGKLAVSCTDSSIVLWGLDQNKLHPFQVSARFPTPHTQCGLLWEPRYKLLYSASVAGLVHAWDVDTKKEITCMYGHNDMVMNLCDMKQLEAISSCSMDRNICVWDLHTGARRQKMEGHQKGVLSLTYNDDFKLLLSAGFEHDANVWSPFSPTVIFKLKGHKNSLVSIDSIEGTNQVVTADTDGTYKIWDLRNFQCVQTFSAEVDEMANLGLEDDSDNSQLTSFTLCQNRIEERVARLIGTTRRLHVFEQGIVNVDTGGADDLPIQAAIYNDVLSSIITTHGCSVKIWNALIGKLEKAYFDLTVNGSDITAIVLDNRKRKFIIGDHLGDIQIHNYQSGALMKVFDPHASQITSLKYIDELKYVVSVSWDGAIVVHDEDPPDHGVVVRTMDVAHTHRGDISCAAVSYNLTLLATGAADKTVRIWDTETGKIEAKLEFEHEINEIVFLHPYPLIVIADSAGIVWVYGVRGSIFKYHCPLHFCHFYKHEGENDYMASDSENSKVMQRKQAVSSKVKRRFSLEEHRTLTPVLCLDWDNESRLYTGGDRGQVACWDFTEVIKTLNVAPAGHAKEEVEKKSKKKTKLSHSNSSNGQNTSPKDIEYHLPSLNEEIVKFEWSVAAHTDSVSSIQFIPSPASILSSSHDHTVRIWGVEGDRKGKRIGSLLQELRGEQKHPQWLFNIDVEKIEKFRNEKTRDIIKTNEEFKQNTSVNKKKMMYEQKVQDFTDNGEGKERDSGDFDDNMNEDEASKYDEDAMERKRERKKKNDEFSYRVKTSTAGNRLTELQHGKNVGDSSPSSDINKASSMGYRSASDSEEELDFDRIGFEEFKREWAASLRSMPDEGNEKEGGKGNDDGTGRSKKAKDSHFSMASTKAIRKRANNKTKKAAFDLDVAIAQSKIRNEVRQHRGNVRADVQKLKERLKKYGF